MAGITETTGYRDLRQHSMESIANVLEQKLIKTKGRSGPPSQSHDLRSGNFPPLILNRMPNNSPYDGCGFLEGEVQSPLSPSAALQPRDASRNCVDMPEPLDELRDKLREWDAVILDGVFQGKAVGFLGDPEITCFVAKDLI